MTAASGTVYQLQTSTGIHPNVQHDHERFPYRLKFALVDRRGEMINTIFSQIPEERGHDVILIGTFPGATCPKKGALLAAHNMGLESCLIGFAVAAMDADNPYRKNWESLNQKPSTLPWL